MDEVIIIITVKYYNDLSEVYSEFASSFNVPSAVYLALLTGGEPAIKNYYESNGVLDKYEYIISASMRIANIVERGQQVHIKRDNGNLAAVSIDYAGNIISEVLNPEYTDKRRKNPKELVKFSYTYKYQSDNEAPEEITYVEVVYALHQDGTYEWVTTCGRVK